MTGTAKPMTTAEQAAAKRAEREQRRAQYAENVARMTKTPAGVREGRAGHRKSNGT